MKPTPVVLAQDTVLQSERDGSERIYWSPSSTFQAFRSATAVDFEWFVHSKLNTPEVKVYGQVSADGRAWSDLDDVGQDGFLGTSISSTDAGDRGEETTWVGGMLSKASFVRFGIQIKNATALQSEIGLTLKLTPRVAGGEFQVADQVAVQTSFPNPISSVVVDARDAKTLGILIVTSGLGASEKVKLALYSSTGRNGVFVPSGVDVELTQSTKENTSLAISAEGLLSFVQVYQVAPSGSAATTGTLTVTATVRPNC